MNNNKQHTHNVDEVQAPSGILYYRTAALRWQDTIHSKQIKNVDTFLSIHDCQPERVTRVWAAGSYAILCLELVDDPHRGIFQQELLIEFPTKDAALAWAERVGIKELVCDHQL